MAWPVGDRVGRVMRDLSAHPLSFLGTPGRRRPGGLRRTGEGSERSSRCWSGRSGAVRHGCPRLGARGSWRSCGTPVGEVPTAHARRGPGFRHQMLQRPTSVTTAELSVTPRVGVKTRRESTQEGSTRTRTFTSRQYSNSFEGVRRAQRSVLILSGKNAIDR
jgi:hypothetical protein